MSFLNKKYSLFNRLSGSIPHPEQFDQFEEDDTAYEHPEESAVVHGYIKDTEREKENNTDTGELPVDVFQMSDDILIHAFVAGVKPDELNVSISRDVVVIEGTRTERQEVSNSDYFTRELFWGSFAKTILLPQEIDVDSATAHSKDGLLTITLPKLDRKRQTKLRVKSG